MPKSPESYKPTPDDYMKADSMMTDDEKRVSYERELGVESKKTPMSKAEEKKEMTEAQLMKFVDGLEQNKSLIDDAVRDSGGDHTLLQAIYASILRQDMIDVHIFNNEEFNKWYRDVKPLIDKLEKAGVRVRIETKNYEEEGNSYSNFKKRDRFIVYIGGSIK